MKWKPEERYKLLLAINNAIISKLDQRELFETLVVELKKYFPFNRLTINLQEEDGERLSYFSAVEKGSNNIRIIENKKGLGQATVAKMVIDSGKPVTIGNLMTYSKFDSIQELLKSGMVSTMAFPLLIKSRILGSIHFSFKKPPSHSLEMSQVLKEVSQQITIAIDHMLSYSNLLHEKEDLDKEKRFLIEDAEEPEVTEGYFYTSSVMRQVMKDAQKAAASDTAILITGETGTGKDYLARYIHQLSDRKNRLLVKVNCPALSATLFESELFGHSKGSFTGAETKRIGRFEMADKGTVFLDEVSEIPVSLQAKLLHVLEDKKIERIGENKSIHVDFRVVSATNRDLAVAMQNGSFRQDLFYRLNAFTIHVPALRERKDGIPYLIRKLNSLQANKINKQAPDYTDEAIELMTNYPWPGNVRELKNVIDRLIILKSGGEVESVDIRNILHLPQDSTGKTEFLTLAEAEKGHLIAALKACNGRVGGEKGAAVLLGIPRTTLQYRLAKYGIRIKKGDKSI